jgi:hypothetical protein
VLSEGEAGAIRATLPGSATGAAEIAVDVGSDGTVTRNADGTAESKSTAK